jgi:hypothetical protein
LCLGGQYIIFPQLLSFALQATASVLPEDPGVLRVGVPEKSQLGLEFTAWSLQMYSHDK